MVLLVLNQVSTRGVLELGVKGRLRCHTKHQGLRLRYEGNPTASFSFSRHFFSSTIAAYRQRLAVAASASGSCFPSLRYVSAPDALTFGSCAAPLQMYLPFVYTSVYLLVFLSIQVYTNIQKYALRVYRCKPPAAVVLHPPPVK